MKENIYIPTQRFDDTKVLVRMQCGNCNGTGGIINSDAEDLRIRFAKYKNDELSEDEIERLRLDRIVFENEYRYCPITRAGTCIHCDGNGFEEMWVGVSTLLNN